MGKDTALAQIAMLVEDAQTHKAPIQHMADRISRIFVPIVLAISALTFVVWITLSTTDSLPDDWIPGDRSAFVFSLIFALSVLVIACPCALGLATPTAVMVGTGVAAKMGVLIKGGDVLQAATNVSVVCFDKTGTLTTGEPSVTHVLLAVQPASAAVPNKRALLFFVASAELGSEHPIGRAIVEHAEQVLGAQRPDGAVDVGLGPVDDSDGDGDSHRGDNGKAEADGPGLEFELARGRTLAEPIDFRAVPGNGLSCSVQAPGFAPRPVLVGNRRWMLTNDVPVGADLEQQSVRLERQGQTVVFCAVDGICVGAIAVADKPRPEARAVVAHLREQLGVSVWMVTGDNSATADAIAASIGLDNVFSEVLPADKVRKSHGKIYFARACVVRAGAERERERESIIVGGERGREGERGVAEKRRRTNTRAHTHAHTKREKQCCIVPSHPIVVRARLSLVVPTIHFSVWGMLSGCQGQGTTGRRGAHRGHGGRWHQRLSSPRSG